MDEPEEIGLRQALSSALQLLEYEAAKTPGQVSEAAAWAMVLRALLSRLRGPTPEWFNSAGKYRVPKGPSRSGYGE